MLKFLRIPFGQSGDRAAVPDAVVPAGDVSYTEGYGIDYARPKTDPLSKNIEREKMNQLFFDATAAIGELQAQGVPDFITTALNGGSPYSYEQNALVRWTDEQLYVSLVASNTALPTDATKWALFDANFPERLNTASATDGANLVAFNPALANAAGLGLFLTYVFGRSAVEIAAGVTPTNYAHPVGLVERYGAVGDGVTDDSAAFATAFSLGAIGTRPGYVKTTPGKFYSVADLTINGPTNNNNTRGEYSLVFDYRGSTLIGRSTATVILRVGSDTGTATWANGVRVLCGTMDMSAMTDATTHRGIEYRNAYNLNLDGHTVVGEGSNKIGLYFRDRAYTGTIINVSCLRVNVVGANIASDAVTTLTFITPDIGKLTLTRTSSIRVTGGAIQSASGDKVALSEVYDITIDNVDIEGAAGTAYAFGSSCSYIRIRGGNITSALTPFTGTPVGSDLGPIRYRGEYHNLYGRPNTNFVGNGPHVLWTMTGDPAPVLIFTISGDNGNDGFSDEIKVAFAAFKVLDTWNAYGSPSARTYSISGNDFRVAFTGAPTFNIKVAVRVNPD